MGKFNRYFIATIAILLAAINVSGQEGKAMAIFNEGLEYYNGNDSVRKDQKKAFELFLEAANLGLNYAMLNVGSMLYDGAIVNQDFKGALYWYTKAAEKDVPAAYINLGWYYLDNLAVERDADKAIGYLSRAFELGEVEAAHILSELYATDDYGVKKNLLKVLEWNEKLADVGDVMGLYNVGICYVRGEIVDVDEQKATYSGPWSASNSSLK